MRLASKLQFITKKNPIRVFTIFHSFTPFSYKIGLTKTLVYSAFKVSFDRDLFHKEIIR